MGQTIVIAVLTTWAVAVTVLAYLTERDLKVWRDHCMAAWTRLDERTKARDAERRERDQLIRRLARAEALIDGLRSIATQAAVLARLDALRADSCFAPFADSTTENLT